MKPIPISAAQLEPADGEAQGAGKMLNEDRDAVRWAREFDDVLAKEYNIRVDEGLLIAWFANAMMCGEDTYRWRQEAALRDSIGAAQQVQQGERAKLIAENHQYFLIASLCQTVANHDVGEKLDNPPITHPVIDAVIQLQNERDTAVQELTALRAGAKVPEGWKLAPMEPTEQMIDAPRYFIMYCETPGRDFDRCREHLELAGIEIDSWPEWAKTQKGHITKAAVAEIAWSMMLAAAPSAKGEG